MIFLFYDFLKEHSQENSKLIFMSFGATSFLSTQGLHRTMLKGWHALRGIQQSLLVQGNSFTLCMILNP